MIAKYVWSLREKMMRKFYDEFSARNACPPPIDIELSHLPPVSIGSFFMCDGQPAAQLSKIIAADNGKYYLGKKDTPFPKNLFPERLTKPNNEEFDKWFHSINNRFGFVGKSNSEDTGSQFYGLKTYNCCGMMFRNFLEVFFRAWRITIPKVHWILDPNDPRQLVNELYQYVLAHYRSAFIYCWQSWGKRDDKVPTPSDIHKYMLSRSKECPFRLAVILQLLYADITKLMKMAAKVGKRGSVDIFLTCLRFAMHLWATTHAVDYVRLGWDMLILMHCASPALKSLYAGCW
ncbi:hypothetical protein ACHAWF_001594 [Thalassiosira exigua]